MKLTFPAPGESLTAILKLAGEACNINCYYCYEKRRPYEDDAWISPATLRKFLDAAGDRRLRVVFQGGEPMLIGIPRMRALLEVLRDYPGPLRTAMQTNGTLISDAWLDLFDELAPDIDIGVSLDGPRSANAYRVDYRDLPAFDRIVRGIEVLARRGREIGICVTVTRLLLGLERQTLEQIAEFPHVRAVRLSPCLDYNVVTRKFPKGNAASLMLLNGSGSGAPGWATTPMEYAKFVAGCFDVWRMEYVGRFLVEPLFSILLTLSGGTSTLTDWSATKEPFIVAVYPDGRLGTSDEISGMSTTIGSVDTVESLEEILEFQRAPHLRKTMGRHLEVCGSCRHEAVCAGGSLADRMRLDNTPWSEEYCDSRRWLIDYVKEAM